MFKRRLVIFFVCYSMNSCFQINSYFVWWSTCTSYQNNTWMRTRNQQLYYVPSADEFHAPCWSIVWLYTRNVCLDVICWQVIWLGTPQLMCLDVSSWSIVAHVPPIDVLGWYFSSNDLSGCDLLINKLDAYRSRCDFWSQLVVYPLDVHFWIILWPCVSFDVHFDQSLNMYAIWFEFTIIQDITCV